MTSHNESLLPARFLVLSAHLVLTITLLSLRDENVRAGLPLVYKTDDYDRVDTRFIIALCITLLGLVIEFVGFFGGFSTFHTTTALISVLLHLGACVSLALFVWDTWHADLYWWLVVVFSLPAALLELMGIVRVAAFKTVPA